MSRRPVSRRSVLFAGGAVAGIGTAGAYLSSTANDDLPGAQGFTAKSAPARSDPLVAIDVDRVLRNPAISAGASALLDAQSFAAFPASLTALFDSGVTVIDPNNLGKLVCIETTDDEAAAVVWAEWTREDLVAVVEDESERAAETRSYRDRTTYATDGVAGAVLADEVFAVGSMDAVRSVVDVWHSDAEPVEDAVLGPFERTPPDAPVRFAASELGFDADVHANRSDTYERIENRSGWIAASDEPVLGVQYGLESIDDVESVIAALRSDLAEPSEDDSDDSTLSDAVRNDVSVDRTGDVVTVTYRDAAEPFTDQVGEALRAFATIGAG